MKLIASAGVGMMLAAMTMVAGCSASRGLGAPPTTGTTSVTSAALSLAPTAPMEPAQPTNASTLVPAAWEDELEAVAPAPPTWGTLAVPPTTTATR